MFHRSELRRGEDLDFLVLLTRIAWTRNIVGAKSFAMKLGACSNLPAADR
jgi:hypothetical protein